jgi:hypothetical protein
MNPCGGRKVGSFDKAFLSLSDGKSGKSKALFSEISRASLCVKIYVSPPRMCGRPRIDGKCMRRAEGVREEKKYGKGTKRQDRMTLFSRRHSETIVASVRKIKKGIRERASEWARSMNI